MPFLLFVNLSFATLLVTILLFAIFSKRWKYVGHKGESGLLDPSIILGPRYYFP